MKFFEPNEKRNTVAVYSFLVALFCVLCVIIGINISVFPKLLSSFYEIIKPILYGFIIAFLLHPIVRLVETKIFGNGMKKREGFRRFLSVMITYIVVIALIVLFCLTVIPQIVENYDKFAQKFWDYIEIFRNKTAELINSTSGESIYLYTDSQMELKKDMTDGLFGITLRNFDGTVYAAQSTSIILEVRNIFDNTLTAIGEMISSSLPSLFNSAVTVLTETKNLLIGIFISLYFLLGERKHIKRISFVFKAWMPKRIYNRVIWLTDKAKNIFRDYIIVRLLDGFIVGILMYILLLIFGVEYRIFLAVLMGAASFFPFIGPIIGIAAGTFLMLFVDIKYALFYLILSLILQILEMRYVEPVLTVGRDEYTLPAVWVFAAIIIMGGFFGVLGILIGIPLFAFIYSIIKDLCEKRLVNSALPADTRNYFNIEVSLDKKIGEGVADDALDMRTYYDERREMEEENAEITKEALSKLADAIKHKKEKRKLKKEEKRQKRKNRKEKETSEKTNEASNEE